MAIPVAPPSVIEALQKYPEVNEVLCLEIPYNFSAVGQFYEDFSAVSDEQAISYWKKVIEEAPIPNPLKYSH